MVVLRVAYFKASVFRKMREYSKLPPILEALWPAFWRSVYMAGTDKSYLRFGFDLEKTSRYVVVIDGSLGRSGTVVQTSC